MVLQLAIMQRAFSRTMFQNVNFLQIGSHWHLPALPNYRAILRPFTVKGDECCSGLKLFDISINLDSCIEICYFLHIAVL